MHWHSVNKEGVQHWYAAETAALVIVLTPWLVIPLLLVCTGVAAKDKSMRMHGILLGTDTWRAVDMHCTRDVDGDCASLVCFVLNSTHSHCGGEGMGSEDLWSRELVTAIIHISPLVRRLLSCVDGVYPSGEPYGEPTV